MTHALLDLRPSGHHVHLQEGTAHLIDGRTSSDSEVPARLTSAGILRGDQQQRFSYLYTARTIWQPAASVCSVYTITIAIFPGFLAEDISSQQLGSWYPILLITAFNIADAAGKIMPVQAQFAMQNRHLILNLCLARLLFLPAFYVAASQGFGPSVMSLLTLALGLSNGYLTAVAMMVAPQGLQVRPASPMHIIMSPPEQALPFLHCKYANCPKTSLMPETLPRLIYVCVCNLFHRE